MKWGKYGIKRKAEMSRETLYGPASSSTLCLCAGLLPVCTLSLLFLVINQSLLWAQ